MLEFWKPVLVAGFVLAVLAGCTTHKSSLQAPEGQQVLYVTDDERGALAAAHSAMVEAKPSEAVTDLTGPVRGYFVYWRFMLDDYRTTIRILRGQGTTSSGQNVSGYYLEVSGAGSLTIQGSMNDSKVFDLASQNLAAISKPTRVRKIQRTAYLLDSDRWRLNDSPSVREGGTVGIEGGAQNNKSVKERLEELNQMREEGLITEEEYIKGRKAILEDL